MPQPAMLVNLTRKGGRTTVRPPLIIASTGKAGEAFALPLTFSENIIIP
jgi:hypothetical protein